MSGAQCLATECRSLFNMKVGLSLGSNLGDRLAQLQSAKVYLGGLASQPWLLASAIYETAPIDCPPGSAAFLNAVVEIEFSGSPRTLLQQILAYEAAQGRDRSAGPNAPRTIDIDILYFGDTIVADPDLTIPHPRLAVRRFVLVPLLTICPDRIVAGLGRTVRALGQELPDRCGEVRFVQQDW